MKGLSEGFLGRQLLSIRNRISSETDPFIMRKFRRKEIRILLQLGNISAAQEICEKLIADYPSWAPGYSIKADLACWSGKWDQAESLFDKAADEHEKAGIEKAAARLRTGPVYRLAEARGDYAKCLLLTDGAGDLKSILRSRSERLSGNNEGKLLPLTENWLAQRLLTLEKAWRGASPEELLFHAVEWDNTEPEWRWRFIIESREIWRSKDLDLLEWSRPVKDTVCPVLDPRFNAEWRILANDR